MESSPLSAFTTSAHCEHYCQHVKSHQALLQAAWDDLEIASEEQTQELQNTAHRAEDIWKEAVRLAERQRASVREQTEESKRRIAKLQAELSDESFPEESVQDALGLGFPQACQAGQRTLRSQLDLVDRELQVWLNRKADRQERFEVLKDKCERLRAQLGMAGSSVPVKTVTLYILDGLGMELQKLEGERAERLHRLDIHFKELRKICMALGEDEGALAAAIHPTLGTSRDAQSSNQDLSDKTFDGLRKTTLDLQDLEKSRAEQGETLMNTLHSLWDALDVAPDDVDRELFGRLMRGPSRLYQSSLDKCAQEVTRLEGARKDLMLSIIGSKREHIAAVCAMSHLAVPPLPEAQSNEPGEVADLLARVLKQLSACTKEAEGRQEVLAVIQALDTAIAEAQWLADYEVDPLKYKGRDSTRKIQRAIAAGEQRKQLPQLIAQVESALNSYRNLQGRMFAYDGADYQAEIFAPTKKRLQQEEERKAQATKSKDKSAPESAKKPSKALPGTPKRAIRTGLRVTQDGSIRKPTTLGTPHADRRRTDSCVTMMASTLTRTDSTASRSDVDTFGSTSLGERVNRLLQSATASPTVSRTASCASDVADRERHIPEAAVFIQLTDQQQKTLAADGKLERAAEEFGKLDIDSQENEQNAMNTGQSVCDPVL